MGSGNLAPDDAKVGLLGLAGNGCLFFGPVNVGALLADVPGGLLLGSTSLHLEESGVFALIGQTALETGENCLGVQSAWLGCHL